MILIYPIQSKRPLNFISPSALLSAWSRVLMTSNGFTAKAAVEPATHPVLRMKKKKKPKHFVEFV